MRPSKRRDARQELRENAESVALDLRDTIAEVKHIPVNNDGGKEVQARYAEMLALQCHLALHSAVIDPRLALKSAVDGGARDREDLGEVADAVLAGVVHAPQLASLSLGQLGLLAAQLSLRPGDGHPLAGP